MLVGGSLWLRAVFGHRGAMLATVPVLALARGGVTARVLLTGVVVASACGAAGDALLVLATTDNCAA